MTTILGVQHDSGFVIAADSQTTELDRPYSHPDVKKIVQHGDWVIAGAGTSVLVDSVQANIGNLPHPRGDEKDLYRYVVSELAPEVRRAHSECGYTQKDSDTFQLIIGLKNNLYYMSSDYSIFRTDTGLYCAGSGGELALGAYAAGASLQKSMKIASRFDVNTGGRIQIVKRGVLNA